MSNHTSTDQTETKAYRDEDRTGHRTPLSTAHRRMLEVESGITPEVIAERAVRSIARGRELPKEYSWRQRKLAPGIEFTIHRPNGERATVFRPDKPDSASPGSKYEQPPKKKPGRKHGGPGNVLDVHPSLRHLIADASVPALFTEGIKKADSITSAARREGIVLLAIGISGVWNWLSEGEPIPDMYDVPVTGRRVYICFDSDMLRNRGVLLAAERKAEHMTSRGAEVWVVYLPDQPDGSKTGADDFLAGGRTLDELLALARPYHTGDLHREKLSRSERLRLALDYLKRRADELPARTRRDCSKRAVWRVFVHHAEKRGKLVGNTVDIRHLSTRTGAEEAAMSHVTFAKCVADLEADGDIQRGERKTSEEATPYILPIPGGVFRLHSGEDGTQGEDSQQRQSNEEDELPRGVNFLPPLPEMRWSSPGRRPRRGTVKGTRQVRQGHSASVETPSTRRPGKKRGEIIRYLVACGGAATRRELLQRFGSSRTTWRDFRRQTLADLLGYRRAFQGQPLTVGPPVVELDADGIHLVEDWREALEQHRILGAEEEVAKEQKADHLRQRSAFLQRNKVRPDRAPTEEEMDSDPRREARKKRQRVTVLVAQGMHEHVAMHAVFGAHGFISDLSPEAGPDPPPQDPADPGGDWRDHPLACECLRCTVTEPGYARPV